MFEGTWGEKRKRKRRGGEEEGLKREGKREREGETRNGFQMLESIRRTKKSREESVDERAPKENEG